MLIFGLWAHDQTLCKYESIRSPRPQFLFLENDFNVSCVSSQNEEFILNSACSAGGHDGHRGGQYEEKRFLFFIGSYTER